MRRRWTNFGDEIGTPNKARPLPDDPEQNKVDKAYNVHDEHASLLANKSPEEDYVEACKFEQLSTAHGPGRLIIRIPRATGTGHRDVQLNDRRNDIIVNKMKCAVSGPGSR